MQSYRYKARDNFGKLVDNIMTADSELAVAKKLNQLGYIPISIHPIHENNEFFARLFGRFGNVSIGDIAMFTRQFSALQKAGIPIRVSLNALREQATNKTLKRTIDSVIKDIEAGMLLSGAMAKHPKVFSELYINMITAGEASGLLDEALDRLAVLSEHDESIRLKIKAATRYPVIVVIAIVLGFLVLTTMVVPRFAKIYSQFTVQLPFPTRVLIGINYAVTKFWWLIILLGGIFAYLFKRVIKTDSGRIWWDTIKLKVPIFGPLVLKLTMSRFARISGTLLKAGVPILNVLDLSTKATGNVVVSRVIENIRVNVSEGKGMTEPMKISGMFPPVVIQMVSVGESTGKLDELLMHVSNYYDSQVDYTISNLTTLIEPILIFVLGCIVLFMALGIFLPVWNLMNVFKR
ncbi:MAG: type II secretion system F family protein [Candidatus Omnitrophota bacterium]|jgi:type II secretory pathway component PulF|nr:MAG: type II secretion system F family protein [Candidatus Omnitrophota bacterium]